MIWSTKDMPASCQSGAVSWKRCGIVTMALLHGAGWPESSG